MCACVRVPVSAHVGVFFGGLNLKVTSHEGGGSVPTVSGTQEKPYKFQSHLRNIGNLIRA